MNWRWTLETTGAVWRFLKYANKNKKTTFLFDRQNRFLRAKNNWESIEGFSMQQIKAISRWPSYPYRKHFKSACGRLRTWKKLERCSILEPRKQCGGRKAVNSVDTVKVTDMDQFEMLAERIRIPVSSGLDVYFCVSSHLGNCPQQGQTLRTFEI